MIATSSQPAASSTSAPAVLPAAPTATESTPRPALPEETTGDAPESAVAANDDGAAKEAADDDNGDPHKLDATRYERTSELIKAFKHSCARVREEFRTLEMELPDFTAVLDELTKNTYVLIVVHDPTIGGCLYAFFGVLLWTGTIDRF